MNLAAVRRLSPSLKRLQTAIVLISGGEPLLNPEWVPIVEHLAEQGMEAWLLTSGLSLAKHSAQAARLFKSITVSLDGTDRPTYQAIRGLDALDKVCAGIGAAAAAGVAPSIRVTVQRANYRQLPQFVDLAKRLGARQVSFLAVDVANPHAFARTDDFSADLALRREDLPIFEGVLSSLAHSHAQDFRSGFIAERPEKLRRLLDYFTAIHGLGPYPPVRCNAPEFSAVITAVGRVQPCFFIQGPAIHAADDLDAAINEPSMTELRSGIRQGRRPECATCVCSMWRDPAEFSRC
jgi:MoaA/NifB/PqqE/SkfB family radical SAM enzyme